MNRIAILYFTDKGAKLGKTLAEKLEGKAQKPPKGGLASLAEKLFHESDALIFIGACGIAVRAIAPLVASKTSDPAVIAMDEQGKHVISLLSGHIGGANGLARRIAGYTGGKAVITTATDVSGRFSIDAWATKNGCVIDSMESAKAYAAAILQRDLPLVSDYEICGNLPAGVFLGSEGRCGAVVSVKSDAAPFDTTLRLIPRILHVGIGCKRGTPAEKISDAVDCALSAKGIDRRAIKAMASIDVKEDEQGLCAYCRENRLPVRFYSAQELQSVEGEFSHSERVFEEVGVGNVCDRAAMCSAGKNAELIVKKTVLHGVTVGIAQEKWSVAFE
jgi:cobalt-precorrin 5A hydrolase